MEHINKFVQKQLDIASQLIDLIEKLNISQRKLAKLSGVDEPTISEIKRGLANPTLETISKLETALEHDLIVAPSFYKKDLEKDGYMLVNTTSLRNKFNLTINELWETTTFSRKGKKTKVKELEFSKLKENSLVISGEISKDILEAA